tara:strand:- start:104 stop:784 length:681 start_codon:yes stop_codon:yes gene_type:complete
MAKFAKKVHENNEILLIKKFIRIFRSKLQHNKKRRFSFVLTGGNSPIKLYKFLAKNKKINWKNIDFFIGDERFVKESSKNSNIGMCKKHLLNKINISKKQIYKISTEKFPLKESVIDYENKIKKYFFGKNYKFDIVLLGIGNDGHIASLFRNNINKNNNKNVKSVRRKDFFRITLTLKSINNAKNIFLWAPGKNKSSIVKKILKDNKLKYPASFLKEKNNFLFYCN